MDGYNNTPNDGSDDDLFEKDCWRCGYDGCCDTCGGDGNMPN